MSFNLRRAEKALRYSKCSDRTVSPVFSRSVRIFLYFLLMFMLPLIHLPAQNTQEANQPPPADPVWVKVARDPEFGWRMLVDGEEISIHGVVWAFTPIGETTTYDLWSMPDEFIQRMIDTDGVLLQEMGVNAIRVFSDVPPKWITYFYEQYGIYSVVNPLFGRYGLTVEGRWYPRTNYADVNARQIILDEVREVAETYKNVPGVLFYLLGNENNYGLEWESESIEDLPVGQRLEVRAGYLYSLFEEGINIVKDIDPTKPVGIVNGDIQYLNIIEALVPSLDILGVNTYRGDAAYDLFYSSVDESLDVPLVFTELGADAYNIATQREDQYNQALILKNQWEEIYQQSYGKGNVQNALGAFVFEWIDEWWKHGQFDEDDLFRHDTDGTWANAAYQFDAVPGENNMNEEWFGIVAQSTQKRDGINVRVPRAAYYMLKDLWTLDQLESTPEEVEEHFAINILPYVNRGEIAALQQENEEDPVASLRGSYNFVGTGQFTAADLENIQSNGLNTSFGQWLTLGIDVNPIENLSAGVTVRVQGDVPDTIFENQPYTRYAPLEIRAGSLVDTINPNSDFPLPNQDFSAIPRVDIYNAYLNWQTEFVDIDLYYHNGHTDWVAEGDFFNFLPETFDFFGMDLEGAKAPFGVELTGRSFLEGLKIYAGPEIYWGAEPQAIIKYYDQIDFFSWSLIYNEAELFSNNATTTGTQSAENAYDRRASAYFGFNFLPAFRADIGIMMANLNDIGERYTDVRRELDGSMSIVPNQELTFGDTLGAKFQLSTEILLNTRIFARYNIAGRLAESNRFVSREGSHITDSGTGNRHEIEAGFTFFYGPFSITPKFLARIPLTFALPQPNGGPRRTLTEPFGIFHNREAYQMEVVLGWDTAGETYFHEWNNSDRENAPFAASIAFLYSFFEGETDATSYINERGDDMSFPLGLPAVEGLWRLTGRFVFNPISSVRIIADIRAGSQQSLGGQNPMGEDRIVTFFGVTLATRIDTWLISASIDIDNWGQEDFYRQLNLTYPFQWALDISYGFTIPSFLETENRIGIEWSGRTFNEFSPESDTDDGQHDWRMKILAYLSIIW